MTFLQQRDNRNVIPQKYEVNLKKNHFIQYDSSIVRLCKLCAYSYQFTNAVIFTYLL